MDGVAVEGGEALVERDDATLVVACERHEIGIGDLAVADDADEVGCVVGQVVGPEGVPLLGAERFEHR